MAIILLIFTAAGAAYAMGGREDPLLYADRLIEQQKYDEAIVYLTEFIKQNPDRFDAAQDRLRRITKIRAAYNSTATDLLAAMEKNPLDQATKLALISELERLESTPNPAVREFVEETKVYALFTYNNAKFDEIMGQGRALIDERRFAEAARVYETGFELYRPEFTAGGFGEDVVSAAFERVGEVSASIASLGATGGRLEAAFAALATAYASRDAASIDAAWLEARASALAMAESRRATLDDGRALESSFAALQEKDPALTDSSFMPFAYRFVLGRRSEGRLEGVVGAMDAEWNYALGVAQAALEAAVRADIGAASAAFDGRSWDEAQSSYARAGSLATRGLSLLSLWAVYAPTDMDQRSTALGQAVVTLKGADYLRLSHLVELAAVYGALARAESGVEAEAAALAAYEAPADRKAEALAEFDRRRSAFLSAATALEALRSRSGALASRMAGWTEAGFGSGDSQAEQGRLDGRIGAAIDGARGLETAAVARAASYEYGLLLAASERAAALVAAGKGRLEGQPSDDPLLPDAVFYYPGLALQSFGQADALLKALTSDIQSFLASYRNRAPYIASAQSVLEWTARAEALTTASSVTVNESRTLAARATERKRQADSSRLEAERRVAEARSALKSNNFETAKERLERARDRYLVSLSFEQDAALRASSDAALSDLAGLIRDTENKFVVDETRKLITSGKSSYLAGDFPAAQDFLVQARTRWSTTNATANIEVEYWLSLVRTAITVETGREVPITAPLFPEMSQLLSLAQRYYEEGAGLLAKRDKTGAGRAFDQARQKISEIKLVFPLNKEARVLELKIAQLWDADAFNRQFARMVDEARAKIASRTDLSTAYSDLKDLEAISPRYPGLRALIEQVEILLGFRLPPPDPKALAEARSLTAAAGRIFSSGQVAQFPFARAQLQKALTLDPNNEEAARLYDRLASYIGGDTAIVLSSAAESFYNDAVAAFAGGNYISARANLSRLLAAFPRGKSVQKVSDLDARLTALGY